MTDYKADEKRYEKIPYRRCGHSGILLPAISLDLYHNFGSKDNYDNYSKIAFHAFDNGITHFDLANNYGPEAGAAEENFGRILKNGLGAYRDELLISTKAGYRMWPGPYGEWGSRKHLMASIDQSLKRMGVDYVDIFYSHRPDPETPLEDTMGALADIVKQGKALYIGLANYNHVQTGMAVKTLRQMGVRCLIHQDRYSMLERLPEKGLLEVLDREGIGMVAFSPLSQGLMVERYFECIPDHSRSSHEFGFILPENVTEAHVEVARKLNSIAIKRKQDLSSMVFAWLLQDKRVTSVLIGVDSTEELDRKLAACEHTDFTPEELASINEILRSVPKQ